MAFYYDPERTPTVPSDRAHRANALAIDAILAKESRQALERQMNKELEHPSHLIRQEASRGFKLILYVLLGTIGFLAFVVWEAIVSREIYKVVLPSPTMWWVPIVACMGFGLWASAALGESFRDFRLLNHNSPTVEHEGAVDRAKGDLYSVGQKGTPLGSAFHPAIGALIAIGLLSIIGWFSWYRVDLLRQELGKDPGTFQVYLPVLLYVAEIALGMPAFFVIAYCYATIRLRWLRVRLVQAKSSENILLQAAIESYTDYLQQFNSYNWWADEKQRPRAVLLPPNAELRQLLPPEWGYDPTQGQAGPGAEGRTDPIPGNGNEETEASDRGASPGAGSVREESPSATTHAQQPDNGASRADDLLKLLDEQITSQNGRF